MIAHLAVLIPAAAVAVILTLTLTQKLVNKIAKLNQANKLHNKKWKSHQRIKLVKFLKVKKIICHQLKADLNLVN